MKPVVFLDAAREEMVEAALWYEGKAPGLGADFLSQVRLAIDQIASFPDAGVLVAEQTRRRMVRRFPFGVLYRVEPERVVVAAVMHLRRKPGYWRDRR